MIADHIVPVIEGGGWTMANGQGLCVSCSGIKTAEDRKRRGEMFFSAKPSNRETHEVPEDAETLRLGRDFA